MIELFTAVIVFDLGFLLGWPRLLAPVCWPPFVGKFSGGFEAKSDAYYHTPSGSIALFVPCVSMAA